MSFDIITNRATNILSLSEQVRKSGNTLLAEQIREEAIEIIKTSLRMESEIEKSISKLKDDFDILKVKL